jgi:uncharacterized protein
MSKPDQAGGSLESILASIRRSLAEQSPDTQSEDATAPSDGQSDAQPGPGLGDRLTQRLATTHADEGGQSRHPREDDLSDLLEAQSPGAMPVSSDPAADIVLPASPQPADQDPLWFLSRRPEPEPVNSEEPAWTPAPERADVPVRGAVVAPKPQRPETVRASRPPFFGASAEPGRPDAVVTTDPVVPGVGLMPPPSAVLEMAPLIPPPAVAVPPPASAREPASVKEARRVGDPVPLPAAAPAASSSWETASAQIGPRATEPTFVPHFPAAMDAVAAEMRAPAAAMPTAASNDKPKPASVEPPHAQVDATSPAGLAPSTRALDAMVVEMLQPMLRQWLDENMPRLVAAALKDEAERLNTADRNTDKT